MLHLTCRRQMQTYYERFGFQRISSDEFPPYFDRWMPIVRHLPAVLSVEVQTLS